MHLPLIIDQQNQHFVRFHEEIIQLCEGFNQMLRCYSETSNSGQ